MKRAWFTPYHLQVNGGLYCRRCGKLVARVGESSQGLFLQTHLEQCFGEDYDPCHPADGYVEARSEKDIFELLVNK